MVICKWILNVHSEYSFVVDTIDDFVGEKAEKINGMNLGHQSTEIQYQCTKIECLITA